MKTIKHLVGKSIHFLDIENLCDNSTPTAPQVENAIRDYQREVGIAANDLVVTAANNFNSATAYFTIHSILGRGRNLPPRSGPNAADHELIEAILGTPNLSHYNRVFIGSGDHIFAPVHAHLASLGAHTVAVSRPSGCSAAVRLASRETILLPHHEQVRLARITNVNTNSKVS